MTLAEIMASLQAEQAAGFGRTGSQLSMQAEQEKQDIEKAEREYFEQEEEAGREYKALEDRRGAARAVGAVGGYFLGGKAGSAIGSAVLQTLAGIGRGVKNISSTLAPGMFFGETRKKIESRDRDFNRFVDEANKSYTTKVLESVVTDYLTGELLGRLKMPGEAGKAGEAVAEGVPKIEGVGSSSSLLGGGDLSNVVKKIQEQNRINRAFYGRVGEGATDMNRLIDSDFISRARQSGRQRLFGRGLL